MALDSYLNNIVPNGWFVHGRKGNSLNTGRQIEYSKNWDTATGYATKDGNVFMVKPNPGETIDMTDYDTAYKVASSFFEDYENGELSPTNEEIAQNYLQNSDGDIDEAIETMIEDLNPENIADTAKFWDSGILDPYIWIYEKTDKTFFITQEGAIDISGEAESNANEVIKISTKELKKYFNNNL